MFKKSIAYGAVLALFTVINGCESSYDAISVDVHDVPAYTIQEFLGTVSYRGASFSPDNAKLLVSSNESGIFNAYAIPVDGSETVQLTHSEDDYVFTVGYFPNDERFLYTSDQGGNELNHLFVQSPEGEVVDITPGDGLKTIFFGWAQDDKSFYVGSNERDNRYFDVFEYQVDDYSREMIFQDDVGYNFSSLSPNRRYIAFSKSISNADSDLFLYDRDTEEMSHITEHDGDIQYSAQTFSRDSKSLFYMTDEDSEYRYLVKYDMAEGAVENVLSVDWDIWYAYLSKNGKYMVVGINNDAHTELRLYDAESMEMIDLPILDGIDITSVNISRNESHMSFYASSSRMPSDLYYYDFSGDAPEALTRSLNSAIDSDDLVDGKVVRFISFDGVEIPGILYRPHAASEDNKVPAVLWVHGGPGGQSRVGYNALTQYLVNHGYAVFAINNRGSSGYGKTFFHLDDQKHGQDDLDDCVASKAMLAATGYVDPNRIGILGGSYGGYMALAALTFRPQEFEVGVDLFGISNWVRTLESIPPWWESFRVSLEKEMGPFDDMEFFRAKSPLFHANDIEKPLMVLQGANDPRVIQEESDDIVEAVRANGVPVEYVLFDDEGHGFVKKENQERGYAAILDFLETYLKSSPIDENRLPSPATDDLE